VTALEERVRALEAEVQQLVTLERTVHCSQNSAALSNGEEASLLQASIVTLRSESVQNQNQQTSLPTDDSSLQASASPVERYNGIPQELLPNLGRIGATAFFDSGANQNPFSLGLGSYVGGGVDLPLALLPGGRLSYELSIGVAQNSKRAPLTSNVAQIANLAILTALNPAAGTQNLQQALTGTGAAPFAVNTTAKWNAQIFQVMPLELRYDLTRFDRHRFRPYGVLGLGAYVTLSNQVTAGTLRTGANLPPAELALLQQYFAAGSPFAGALVAGQIAPATQLQQRGLPSGQGGLTLGLQTGGGVEWRFSNALSMALENRYNFSPGGPSYNVTTSRVGWHF
jgi:hypothetical protein